ncbi:putative acyl-coenzyme A synthetase ACSM3, mitochondrial-like [Apostichopus japonicus]|uniref:Putative acyl-coenzyme A synthetase ACSM3, mitochondrial-like n=1 Tax=Stichopus japonicus TaxID=307972 RepID=A0A2G8LBE9_STIJA|nr:putative acyl-coenzyme A synthetase ACSM3, mitochondrial-like [Apostichopus japonicus]
MCILTDANITYYYYLTYQQVALVFYPDRYRIGPFEVESALQEHPAVVESAAVAAKDSLRERLVQKRGGRRGFIIFNERKRMVLNGYLFQGVVKAFITLADGFKDREPEELKKELQDHVKNVTAPYKYPRQIEFVDSLPKTVSGKIRRVELREK